MARLPLPGGDNNTWGDVLNEYLGQAHNADGSAKDASGSSKGVIQLSGDLGGTAASPTVPALVSKADQTSLDAHINDVAGAHAASAIAFTPTGDITATNAQAAVAQASSNLTTHIDTLHIPYVDVSSSWGTRWKAVRGLAGSQKVRVHIWSDSIGADGSGASNNRTTSMAALIESNMHTTYGNGGSGFLSHGYATKTGTWTAGFGFGGTAVTATAAATMSFTAIAGTTIRIYHKNMNITGSYRYSIDGGGFTTVTPPTGFAVEPGAAEVTGLSDTTHTVAIEWVSGTVTISGVSGERSTGVIMSRIGISGRSASHYSRSKIGKLSITTTSGSATVTMASVGAFNSSYIGKYLFGTGLTTFDAQITAVASATSATISANATASGTNVMDVCLNPPSGSGVSGVTVSPFLGPALGRADAVIIMLGANDPANVDNSAATWTDGISNVLHPYYSSNEFDYTPDLIVVIEHMGNWFDTERNWPEIVSAMSGMTQSMGGALVDIWGMGRRSFKYWNDLGHFADAIHPTDSGHALYAQPIIDLLNST